MRYYSNHTAAKLIAILFLVLVISGVFMGIDTIVSAVNAILDAVMPCVIVIGGLYILVRTMFR